VLFGYTKTIFERSVGALLESCCCRCYLRRWGCGLVVVRVRSGVEEEYGRHAGGQPEG